MGEMGRPKFSDENDVRRKLIRISVNDIDLISQALRLIDVSAIDDKENVARVIELQDRYSSMIEVKEN